MGYKKRPINAHCIDRGFLFSQNCLPSVKLGVIRVEILVVQAVLNQPHTLAEALEVHDFSFPQKTDGVSHVRIVAETEDVVVGGAGFLLRRHVLRQVGDGIPLGLERRGGEGHPCGRDGVDARGVIHKIGVESPLLDLLYGEVAGELVHDGTNHF